MNTSPPPMLLIDVGNSSTKFAWAVKSRITHRTEIPTEDLCRGAWLDSPPPFSSAAVCSVVPAATAALRKKLGDELFELRHDSPSGLKIRYPKPETIGPDRLANAIAADALFGAPAIVIDFGTAVTFDILSADRAYVGGIIAPGLGVFTQYLSQRTALLPEIELKEPRHAIGRSTEEAMRSGAVLGYRGLIKELLTQVSAELKSEREPFVIATGGQARLIARRLPEIGRVEPDLTLHGLQIAAERIRGSRTTG